MNRHAAPRCFAAPAAWTQPEIRLAPDETRHLMRVLRRKCGDPVTLFDGCGRSAAGCLTAVDGGCAMVRVQENTVRCCAPPLPRIILAQALPRHNLMDDIIEKAVELGVAGIVPLLAERVEAGRAEKSTARQMRWSRIIRAAAGQCGADWLPELTAPVTPAGLTDRLRAGALGLVGSLERAAMPFKEVVRCLPRVPDELILVIGPEGDLTPAETGMLRAAGARLVSFGPGVMRVATAALYGLSLMRYEFGTGAPSRAVGCCS